MQTGEEQYLKLGQRIIKEGIWIDNPRTGIRCKTTVGGMMTVDTVNESAPMITTRKMGVKFGLSEFLGYLKGLNNAQAFADLGSPTWLQNANENASWLSNPHRKGENDMGYVYGRVGRHYKNLDGTETDQLKAIYDNLSKGYDSRGEIMTFWHPGTFEMGCLRPCLHTHNFVLLGDTLNLMSHQRSYDWALGGAVNTLQLVFFLRLMSQITGLKSGVVYHTISNAHIYENQYELAMEQLSRTPYPATAKLKLSSDIKTLNDVTNHMTKHDFLIEGYDQYHEEIKYPFAV
jgi:thymidylate synthase